MRFSKLNPNGLRAVSDKTLFLCVSANTAGAVRPGRNQPGLPGIHYERPQACPRNVADGRMLGHRTGASIPIFLR